MRVDTNVVMFCEASHALISSVLFVSAVISATVVTLPALGALQSMSFDEESMTHFGRGYGSSRCSSGQSGGLSKGLRATPPAVQASVHASIALGFKFSMCAGFTILLKSVERVVQSQPDFT